MCFRCADATPDLTAMQPLLCLLEVSFLHNRCATCMVVWNLA
jgi:hypothetical protein